MGDHNNNKKKRKAKWRERRKLMVSLWATVGPLSFCFFSFVCFGTLVKMFVLGLFTHFIELVVLAIAPGVVSIFRSGVNAPLRPSWEPLRRIAGSYQLNNLGHCARDHVELQSFHLREFSRCASGYTLGATVAVGAGRYLVLPAGL